MATKPNGSFVDDNPGDPIQPIGVSDGGTSEVRPTGNDSEFQEFDPSSGVTARTDSGGGAGTGNSGTGKRRGRPPGSKNATGTGTKKTANHLGGIETVLLTIHFGLAAAFSTPELELGEDEAKALADGMANVAATYDHNMNPRTLAWAQMAVIAGGIYGTRVFAIRARQAKEARGGNEAKPVLVVNPRKTDAKIVERPGGNISTPLTPADIFGLGYGATIPEGL